MRDLIKNIGFIVLGIFAAGALLNLAASIKQSKPLAEFITKGYGAL
jgi:hypothetical protein